MHDLDGQQWRYVSLNWHAKPLFRLLIREQVSVGHNGDRFELVVDLQLYTFHTECPVQKVRVATL